MGATNERAESEKLLKSRIEHDPEDLVATTMYAARLVRIGWEIRIVKRAKYVSQAKFDAFHDHHGEGDSAHRVRRPVAVPDRAHAPVALQGSGLWAEQLSRGGACPRSPRTRSGIGSRGTSSGERGAVVQRDHTAGPASGPALRHADAAPLTDQRPAAVMALADAHPDKQDAALGAFVDVLAKLRWGTVERVDMDGTRAKAAESLVRSSPGRSSTRPARFRPSDLVHAWRGGASCDHGIRCAPVRNDMRAKGREDHGYVGRPQGVHPQQLQDRG